MPPGPIAVFASNFSTSAPSWTKAHTSRKGVIYNGLPGANRYQSKGIAVPKVVRGKEFVLGLRIGKTDYLQRHGTIHRLDKLEASGVLAAN